VGIKKIFFGNNSGKQIFIRLIYFFGILLLCLYAFAFLPLAAGCGLGSSSAFDCRVILPILPIAFILGIFSIFFLKKENVYIKKTFTTIFWISALLPLILAVFYYSFPNHLQWKYFEGYQVLQSCDTGGYHYISPSMKTTLDDSVCHRTSEICGAIQGSDSDTFSCFRRHNYEITDFQECSAFSEEGYVMGCYYDVARNNEDLNYCQTLNNPEYSHQCSMEVNADFSNIRKISTGKGNLGIVADNCKKLGGIDSDICLADISYRYKYGRLYGYDVCFDIETGWIKNNCEAFYQSKE
jgi:hypothetical protein